MLRQIHIFLKAEHLFCKAYAMALSGEELNNVKEIIQEYIDMPMPGKTFNRPVSNFQIFHRGAGELYFLFVTDLVDSPQILDDIIKNTIEKFEELFPDPIKIKESSPSKFEFMRFLDLIQKDLHSKIAIIGPTGSGKTTIYNMLRSGGERSIMNFAKSSIFELDGLTFDLWDFQIKDNFSPLWSKFISGSDLVILLFDLSNYHLKVVNHFLNLHKLESNFSRLLMIANKRELVNDEDIRRIKNELNIDDFIELSLNDPEIKQNIEELVKKSVGLKETLPSNFNKLIREADELVDMGNNVQALAKYNELINICNLYQDFKYLPSLQTKADNLRKIIDEKVKIRKELDRKKEFAIPTKLKFAKKIEVKPLPSTKPTPDSSVPAKTPVTAAKTAEKMVSFKPLEKKPKESKIFQTEETTPKPKKLTLTPKDLKIVIPTEKEVKIKETKLPTDLFPKLNEVKKDETKLGDFASELQKIITEKGSTLSLKLCEQLVAELQNSLGRKLNKKDINLAADFFVKQEQM
ncbi:MAG: ADP-ribosylation factor-like protein [Candidatus Hodarchaeota archaeon]